MRAALQTVRTRVLAHLDAFAIRRARVAEFIRTEVEAYYHYTGFLSLHRGRAIRRRICSSLIIASDWLYLDLACFGGS